MEKVFYDHKPNVFEFNSNGCVRYHWYINEERNEPQWDENNNRIDKPNGWSCYVVEVWEPLSKDKIIQKVITSIWDADLENKLINDYNGAKAGLYDENTNARYILNYNTFLLEKQDIKVMIKFDCSEFNIK